MARRGMMLEAPCFGSARSLEGAAQAKLGDGTRMLSPSPAAPAPAPACGVPPLLPADVPTPEPPRTFGAKLHG